MIKRVVGSIFFIILAATPVIAIEDGDSAPKAAPVAENKAEKAPEEGKQVVSVVFEGNRTIPSEDIMTAIKMQIGDVYDRLTVQSMLNDIYATGWFTDKMRAVPTVNADNKVILKVYLEENRPVTEFTVTGNSVISDGEISQILAPLENKPQNINTLNDAVAKIEQLYASKGYVLARVSAVKDDPDGCVNIYISEGHINSVKFEGNKKTKDFVVERNILSVPGSVYNENTIKEDLIRLFGTQAFKNVDRTIEKCENPDYYDITINLEEQRTAVLNIGAGIDTATGFFGQAGFVENNFLGKGQRVGLNFLAGTGVIMSDDSTLNRANFQGEISLFEPRFRGTDVSVLYKAFWQSYASYQVPLAMERRFGADIIASRNFKNFKHLTGSFKLGIENVQPSEGDFLQISRLYAANNIPFSERAKQLKGGTFLTLAPGLTYDSTDRQIHPRDGLIANIRFTENVGLNNINSTHGILSGAVRKYFPVMTKSSLSFTARAGGAIHGDMPEVMAFRLGGPYSVRGYKLSAIGTGDAYVSGSVELNTPFFFIDRIKKAPFLDNIKLSIFVDAGKLFNPSVTDKIYNRPGYGIAAGAGIKFYVPGIGPLSMDYGYPLVNVGKGNSKGAFTFGIGDMLY